MTSFEKTWAHREVKSMTEKIRDTVKPQGALKPRIQTAVNKLQVQTSKMDVMLTKLHQRISNFLIELSLQRRAMIHQLVGFYLLNWQKFVKFQEY